MGAVNRQAQQFAITLGELIGMFGKGDKFGCANRGEISRVGKQDKPFAAIVRQGFDTIGGRGRKIRCRFIDPRQTDTNLGDTVIVRLLGQEISSTPFEYIIII